MVLIYNLKGTKGAKIKMICHKMNISFKSVGKSEYSMKIIDLLNLSSVSTEEKNVEDFNDEMLLLANFSNTIFNNFLRALNSSKTPVLLKAILTEHNSSFNSYELYKEISAEHKALSQGKKAH